LVSVDVTDTRVGQQTDLDLLQLRVVTDGTISPSAALYQAADILVKISAHLLESAESLLNNKDKATIDTSLIPMEEGENEEEAALAPISIDELDISTRLRNALANNGYTDLRELEGLTEEELRNVKGMGEKSFDELLKVVAKYDINLI
jgi:DNA-directed RNA polymerase subunit alpha